MDFSETPIRQLIPQRPPFLFVDRVVSCDEVDAHTEYRVAADSIMADDGRLSASMKSMQCDFRQTKKMKMLKGEMQSSGVLYFKHPGKLRWQYKTPYSYIFVLNGNKVSIKSANGTQNIDAQRNKMFRQISNIILNCVTGGNLGGTKDFAVEVYKENGAYTAKLLPKKKELKSLYSYIKIAFNAQLTMVESVTMAEKTGDQTTVRLSNVTTNQSISESVFSVD